MKVKIFEGHKVPKGATKYQPDTGRHHESFWDDKGNVWVIGIAERWIIAASVIPNDLIELPEQQEDKVEWVPTVGEECEFTDDMNVFEVCIPRFLGDKTCIIDLPELGAFESYFPIKALKFRPLKTDEQKAREAFHLAVVDACIPIHSDDFNIDEIAGALRHAGFTAPEGGL